MSKEITVLRHYKLAPPFDHWSNMSLQQYLELGSGATDPPIAEDIEMYTWTDYPEKNYDMIITSPARRGIQTTEAIISYFCVPRTYEVWSECAEIPWKPKSTITDEDFVKMKTHNKLRIDTTRVLSINEIIDRIEMILARLQKVKAAQILVITHSFLIAALHAYLSNPTVNITFQDIKKAEIGGVLKGISFTLGSDSYRVNVV